MYHSAFVLMSNKISRKWILKTPTITVPIANHDNNQHAENENLRLQNLWDGLETYVALMRL
jgi:hypothetical protein